MNDPKDRNPNADYEPERQRDDDDQDEREEPKVPPRRHAPEPRPGSGPERGGERREQR